MPASGGGKLPLYPAFGALAPLGRNEQVDEALPDCFLGGESKQFLRTRIPARDPGVEADADNAVIR